MGRKAVMAKNKLSKSQRSISSFFTAVPVSADSAASVSGVAADITASVSGVVSGLNGTSESPPESSSSRASEVAIHHSSSSVRVRENDPKQPVSVGRRSGGDRISSAEKRTWNGQSGLSPDKKKPQLSSRSGGLKQAATVAIPVVTVSGEKSPFFTRDADLVVDGILSTAGVVRCSFDPEKLSCDVGSVGICEQSALGECNNGFRSQALDQAFYATADDISVVCDPCKSVGEEIVVGQEASGDCLSDRADVLQGEECASTDVLSDMNASLELFSPTPKKMKIRESVVGTRCADVLCEDKDGGRDELDRATTSRFSSACRGLQFESLGQRQISEEKEVRCAEGLSAVGLEEMNLETSGLRHALDVQQCLAVEKCPKTGELLKLSSEHAEGELGGNIRKGTDEIRVDDEMPQEKCGQSSESEDIVVFQSSNTEKVKDLQQDIRSLRTLRSEHQELNPKCIEDFDTCCTKTDDDPVDVVQQCVRGGAAPRTPVKDAVRSDCDDLCSLDLDFSSPFKEEKTVSRPVLRGRDASLPGWARYDRYVVSSVCRRVEGSVVLELRMPGAASVATVRTITLRDSWTETPVQTGDVIHVIPAPGCDVTGNEDDVISSANGALLVLCPDRLVSGTSVVAGTFCRRKAVLTEWLRGGVLDSAGSAAAGNAKIMLVGILVHRLFQETMRDSVTSDHQLGGMVSRLLTDPDIVTSAYACGLTSDSLRSELTPFLTPLLAWVRRHTAWGRDAATSKPTNWAATSNKAVISKAVTSSSSAQDWRGHVTRLRDIEENYWSPRLGIKGKIDLTVEVSGNDRGSHDVKVLPLELKTGKSSFSAEHQGQVTLYAMMSAERRRNVDSGLLLYLRTGCTREINAGKHQRRDLIQLRNHLTHYLVRAPPDSPLDPPPGSPLDPPPGSPLDPPPASPLEAKQQIWKPPLPPVIRNERACRGCPYLNVCKVYVREDEEDQHCVAEAGLHLTSSHVDFFLHWSRLVMLESWTPTTSADSSSSGNARLWTEAPEDRQNRQRLAKSLAACRLTKVVPLDGSGVTWLHHMQHTASLDRLELVARDLVVVSTDAALAIAQGRVVTVEAHEVVLSLDRDLSTYPDSFERRYHVDKCEFLSQTGTGINLCNLIRLLDDWPHAEKLRQLLVDKRDAEFVSGLGRDVISRCRSILRPLNKLQQRALLKALMARDFLLIQGMPGTGKTSTIVALVRLLVAMGHSVLLTSYTHSAVDTILLKLKEFNTGFLRLGRCERIHPDLWSYSSEKQAEKLSSVEQLTELYNSTSVVATTCLGINHGIFQRRRFDVCILDEASQVVLPSALGPLLLADRFVLVGDPEQLPPVVSNRTARRLGLDRSLFSILGENKPRSAESVVRLSVQYRMNRTLMRAANSMTYNDSMTCGSSDVELATIPRLSYMPNDPLWLSAVLDTELERSLQLVDTSQLPWQHSCDGPDVYNTEEAKLVAEIAKQLVQRGLAADELGVIAPYRGQVSRLSALLLDGVEVNTVDQYQGRDKVVILYSCTRTAPRKQQNMSDRPDILSDARRLNVALTRARCKMVLVANRRALSTYPPFHRLFQLLTDDDVILVTSDMVTQE